MSFCSKGRIWIGILPILIPVGYETVFEAVRFVRRMFSCERDVFEDCVTMHCLEGRMRRGKQPINRPETGEQLSRGSCMIVWAGCTEITDEITLDRKQNKELDMIYTWVLRCASHGIDSRLPYH